jgi:hypothetical protein
MGAGEIVRAQAEHKGQAFTLGGGEAAQAVFGFGEGAGGDIGQSGKVEERQGAAAAHGTKRLHTKRLLQRTTMMYAYSSTPVRRSG